MPLRTVPCAFGSFILPLPINAANMLWASNAQGITLMNDHMNDHMNGER